MWSSVSAAAVASCCEPVISSVSCACVCWADCPAGYSSVSGTTASDGSSQARSAWKMFMLTPGPPCRPTVTRFRFPVVGYVWCPLIFTTGCPE